MIDNLAFYTPFLGDRWMGGGGGGCDEKCELNFVLRFSCAKGSHSSLRKRNIFLL